MLLCINSSGAQGQETPVGNHEASDRASTLRIAAASGRLVLPAPVRRLSLLGSLGWAGAAPKPYVRAQQRRVYSDRTSARSRDLVGARVV